MPYKAGTLLGNWFEQRLEPVNSESFSGLLLPTGFAHSYRSSYNEMTKPMSSSAPLSEFKPPSDNWLTGGTDSLTSKQRYESASAAAFTDPQKVSASKSVSHHRMSGAALEEYRRKWTGGEPERFH